VGIFRRIGRAVARVFRLSPPTEPPPEAPPEPTGAGVIGDDFPPGVSGPVDNWFIMATWDGPGTKQRYTGPDDLRDLGPGGQVTVAFRHDDGTLTYRTIHGPFRGDEADIWEQIEVTTRVVSPP
jgi:hypothetical protein